MFLALGIFTAEAEKIILVQFNRRHVQSFRGAVRPACN